MSKLKIQYMALDKIKPSENNPRVISEVAIEKVATSIKAFGFKSPIIVDKKLEIIAGHTRLKAAEYLELEEVPVIVVGDLTEEQVRALRIADNKTGEYSDWDMELLKEELKALSVDDFDIEITGFDFTEVERLLNEDDENEEDEVESDTGYIIQYNIIFNDEEEQAEWHDFLKALKEKYPDLETISERLIAHIKNE